MIEGSRTPPIFSKFCLPWLKDASERLSIWKNHPELAKALTAHLSAVAARTLILELKNWREAEMLQGATSEERWKDFSDRILLLPQMQDHLRKDYPLLFPLLDQVTDHFCKNLEEGLARLPFDTKDASYKISHIETGLSDPHADGCSVMCLTFENGKKWIYKPRSVRGEAWWADFVAWWNASGVSVDMQLCAPKAMDYGDYGWCAFVETREDMTTSSAWFFRLGAHAAITWLFGIGDCHFGNLITSGEHPVLVDAECVTSAFWHPLLPEVPLNLPELFTPTWETPLMSGFFPSWMMPKIVDQPLYLSPGMGGTEDRPLPVKRPVWYGIDTDQLHMKLTAGLTTTVHSRPGTSTSPHEIREGFRLATKHLLKHREEILSWTNQESPLDPLQIRPRILLRNTTSYQQILEAASGPRYLTSIYTHRTALQTIGKTPVIGAEEPEGLVDAEFCYLEAQTYPRFVVHPDGTHITSDNGKATLLERDPKAVKERFHRRWLGLSDAKIDWCAEIIHASCRQAAEPRIALPKENHEDRFLLMALEIGKALERQAILTEEGACWLSLTTDAQGNVLTQMPNGDFASGSAGIATFLAQLGKATGEQRWMDLALAAMRWSNHYWTLGVAYDGTIPWSAYYGVGSLFTAGGYVESLQKDPAIHSLLTHWLDVANQDRSWLKMDGDHLSGLPGWALAIASLSSAFPSAHQLLPSILVRLLESSISANLTTPGLAHGTAGWTMAVIAVARALGDDRAMSVAQKVISTFPQLWTSFESRSSVQENPPGGWCNGAIGLMAVAAEHPTTKDQAHAFFQIARPWFAKGYGGHHLCCGEAGRVLLLSRVAHLLNNPEYFNAAQRCAKGLMHYAGQHGFLHLQSIPERLTIPGWLNGISGVGAAMLAIHALQRNKVAKHTQNREILQQ